MRPGRHSVRRSVVFQVSGCEQYCGTRTSHRPCMSGGSPVGEPGVASTRLRGRRHRAGHLGRAHAPSALGDADRAARLGAGVHDLRQHPQLRGSPGLPLRELPGVPGVRSRSPAPVSPAHPPPDRDGLHRHGQPLHGPRHVRGRLRRVRKTEARMRACQRQLHPALAQYPSGDTAGAGVVPIGDQMTFGKVAVGRLPAPQSSTPISRCP